MNILSNIWTKLALAGTFILGILASALMLIRHGRQLERARAKETEARVRQEIAEKSAQSAQDNAKREDIAHEKAQNNDWSGFTDRPDGM